MSAELISAIVWVLVAIAAVLLVALEMVHASNVPSGGPRRRPDADSPRRVVTDEGSVRGTARRKYNAARAPEQSPASGVRHAR